MIKIWFVICCGLLVSGLTNAQTVTNAIDRFDTNSYPNNTITNKWSNWFGGAFQSLSLDPANDANTNPASGSLKIVATFPTNTDQFEVWNGVSGFNPPINGFQFTNFQCDVRFAAGSATNSSGNFGSLQFGVPTPGYGQDYFNGGNAIPASNTNWVHVSIALKPNTDTNLQSMIGLLIHIWGPGLVGPSTLWVDNLQFVGSVSAGTATINYTNAQQRIDGFGASSAWMYSPLSSANADLLFSTNAGIGLSLLRTRIDPSGKILDAEGTIAQQAMARGARVWSTPWSPPAIYKTTNSVNGGSFASSPANYQGYASQLARYVATMKNNYGVNLYAISLQNEPDAVVTYESCYWSAQQFHDFIPYLASALTASNVASTQIVLPEDEGWRWNFANNAMNDVTTSNLVGILGGHNYGSSAAPVTQFGTPCPKTLWETEHYLGTDDSITNGLQLAQEIHSFMTVAQANAYHYWWLIAGGTGGIAGSNTATPAKRLFVMGNYSKFIRPNFYRVGATNTSTALVSAYKDSTSSNFVIVAANASAFPVNQTFNLTHFPAVTRLAPWATTATNSLADLGVVNVTNGMFNYPLPPWSVVSFSSSFAGYPTNLAFSRTGTNLTLTWPLTHLGWTLQAQTNASAAGLGTNWADVAGSATTNQFSVPVNAANHSVFYRLRQ
jgi:glucuronoarabinoxylan endo-1,4-beta-xylanase